jgi:hypothetical protein
MNQEPQSCTKCGCMPEDILMLACSHDLCLNCASDRLAFEMKKNKNANVSVILILGHSLPIMPLKDSIRCLECGCS